MNNLQATEIDLKELIGILRRQIRLIGITFALVLLPIIAYLAIATPIYTTSALISIDAGGSNLLDPSSVENSQSAVLNSRVDGEVEILRADATLMAVVENARLIEDPEFGPKLGFFAKVALALGLDNLGSNLRQMLGIQASSPKTGDALVASTLTQLQNAVEIRRRGLTYLISVSVSAEDPQRAANIANAYVQTYIARQIAAKTEGITSARDVLRGQTESAGANLAQAEDALNAFIDDNLARLEQQSSNSAISALRRELENAKSNKVDNVAILAQSRDAAARNDWAGAAQALGDAALANLAAQREELARRLGDGVGAQEQFALQDALDQLDRDLAVQLSQAQGGVEDRLTSITNAETLAREQLRDALLQSDMSSSLVSDLFNLQQSATIARNQYQQLLARVQELNALANVQIADARIVSEALPPIDPSAPNKRLIIALALVVGLGLGIGMAFLNEYYIGGVTSPEQLANVIQSRVPVSVPVLNVGSDSQSLADQILTAPLSQYSESFRKLRLAIDTALSHMPLTRDEGKQPPRKGRLILICSALPGEGKSTSAIAIARTYAAAGMNTLLVDCDLRKPSIADYIQVDGRTGLIDYLVQEDIHESDIIQLVRDPQSKLNVILAGTRSTQPTDQLINSARFSAIIEGAREMYDMVIIDSPPILPVVDTRYLAQMADVAVMILRYANTTQSEARDAASQIQEVLRPDVALLGVLNRHVPQSIKRGYYNGAYSGYYGEEP